MSTEGRMVNHVKRILARITRDVRVSIGVQAVGRAVAPGHLRGWDALAGRCLPRCPYLDMPRPSEDS